MMPKSNKVIKKGFDPPGNNYIALGTRTKSEVEASSTTTMPPQSQAKQTNFSNSNNSSSTNNLNLLANTNVTSSSLAVNTNNLNLTVASDSIKSINKSNSTNSITSNILDPKTIKEEISNALEKDESDEKLTKIIRSIVISLKNSLIQPSQSSNPLVKQQQNQQPLQQQNVSNENLNYLVALAQITQHKPHLFLKQSSLLEFLCTNLLFTSKLQNQHDKLSNQSNSMIKSKSLHLMRTSPSLQPNGYTIHQSICNILYSVYEDETNWPEIFVKAYIDDSLGERAWVDNTLCEEFVENIKTAFSTKSIPFSVDNPTNSPVIVTSNNGSILNLNLNENSNSSGIQSDTNNKTSNGKKTCHQKLSRYSSNRKEIEQLTIEIVKGQLNNTTHKSNLAQQRLLGQNVSHMSSQNVTSVDNRGLIKLLQNTCGIPDIRTISLSKVDFWLANPKLIPLAQDLLLAICINCGTYQNDRDLITQIMKLKPKIKQQQHYYDCIRELIKLNSNNFEFLIQISTLNELALQQQQQLLQQQPQQQLARNQHNLYLLQTAFSTDGTLSSKIFAQTMQRIILQKNGDDYLRLLRILLRDIIRNSRLDFDLIKFAGELVKDFPSSKTSHQHMMEPSFLANFAGGPADFSVIQVKERFVNGIVDLVTVCILVAITPQIKEAYLRRHHDTRDHLIKYYMIMSQIQCDTVTWLQEIVQFYQINPTELIRCMFKVLFMIDKPEQCYTIDNWPSEQERSTMFRVVSEIPVLSETLHQVLMITKSLPEDMYLHMLRVEENLLKVAALVHIKDVYSLKLNKVDQFVQSLFNICLYKFQTASTLVVSVLYWRAWQILLIVSALDPKGFGLTAWEKYPTLRLLMEMIMSDDYAFPPQSSLIDETTGDKFRHDEIQACSAEKQEILDFENKFEMKQGKSMNESNSKLIGQVMKFDPIGAPRRPPLDTIQNIRKLNAEYKLGQLLCKCRAPDLLLSLIKRQNSKLSLPWLSSLIESNSNDCLEIMPIQCICEFVWNVLSGTVEEIALQQQKKQINIDQLLHRIKMILTASDLNDSLLIQQIKDTFDYFLNKLSSDKLIIRNGALRIFNKLFVFQLPGQVQPQQAADLSELIEIFKNLSAFDICIKPLLIKYFRRAIMVETNPLYLNLYLYFIFEQLLDDYALQNELESSLKMEFESISIKSESTHKSDYNEIGMDLADFFFKRNYYLSSLALINASSSNNNNNNSANLTELRRFRNFIAKFTILLLKMNEYNLEDDNSETEAIKLLVKNKMPFDRKNLDVNSYILIELNHPISTQYLYINEKIFNLVIYFFMLVLQLTKVLNKSQRPSEYKNGETDMDTEVEFNKNNEPEFELDFKNLADMLFSSDFNFTSRKYLNCKFGHALNEVVKNKILRLDLNFVWSSDSDSLVEELDTYFECSIKNSLNNEKIFRNREKLCRIRLIEWLIESMVDDHFELVESLFNKHGISSLASYLLIKRVELDVLDNIEEHIVKLASVNKNRMCQMIEAYVEKYKISLQKEKVVGERLLSVLNRISTEKVNNGAHALKKFELFSFDDSDDESVSLATQSVNDATRTTTVNFDRIKYEINQTKSTNKRKLSELMETNQEIEVESTTSEKKIKTQSFDDAKSLTSATRSLISLIDESSNQNLETNLNKSLNEMTNINECILALTESILIYENKKISLDLINSNRSISSSSSSSKNRCIVDILLDYLCHFDPQIINKEFKIEYRLLFELRGGILSESHLSTSAITQSFLLSLFVHQANWDKLHKCVQYLLAGHSFCSKSELDCYMNPSIILDFVSSIIHIPELWKGSESKKIKKYDEETILNLDEDQICCLADFIIEEMCLLYQSRNLTSEKRNQQEKSLFEEIKFKLVKRIQFLKHFLKNPKLNKSKLLSKIIMQLQLQKQQEKNLNSFLNQSTINNNNTNTNNDNNNNNNDINLKTATKKHLSLLVKIQTLFLYCFYLEENSIINHITNPSRLFSNLYFEIDIPTQFDVKAHNLLNCFGEIEVNYSNNLASSGIIGVDSGVSTNRYKKQEKSELVAFNKKQEAFMIEANLVCAKLASTHPFMFIRQLPMMEGLLQGRIVYSFDEFKRRKFDKLFHYIIDILNTLVPYVFHRNYLEHIEAIISHYFDMFMSYCSENRDSIGSLVVKFIEFLEKFINNDIQVGHSLIIRRYSQFISFLQKSYPEIVFLKCINAVELIPFEPIEFNKTTNNNNILKSLPTNSMRSINVLNQKSISSLWSSKQLEPFINKLLNRDSYDGVLSVLQELDAVSQRQPIILSHFVFYLQPLTQDPNDLIRDLSFSLIMRYLRLNPKETLSFYQSFIQCLNSVNSHVFTSAIKIFSDFNLLCSEKSEHLIKSAFRGSFKHNVDISKQLTDTIRLLQLEKYVY